MNWSWMNLEYLINEESAGSGKLNVAVACRRPNNYYVKEYVSSCFVNLMHYVCISCRIRYSHGTQIYLLSLMTEF